MANFGLGLYEPTVELLKLILPRTVKGSIIVFEDLNQETWPGETEALFEILRVNKFTLSRVTHCPHLSWVTVGE